MTAGCVCQILEFSLEFAIVLGFIGNLNVVILQNIDVLVDLSISNKRSVFDSQDDLVLKLVQTVGYFDLSTHHYKRSVFIIVKFTQTDSTLILIIEKAFTISI